MPEGPEIRRAADGVAEAVEGRVLTRVFLAFDRLRAFESELEGQSVLSVDTHGKSMITAFSGGLHLYSHNQLYGRWYTMPAGRQPRTNRRLRVGLHTEKRDALLYSASDVDVLTRDELALHPLLARMGPDALWPTTTWREVDQRLRAKAFRGRSLAAVLLDQGFVAGLGNYLRAEILFAARVAPLRRARDLERSERERLARRTLSVTRRSYRTGGVTIAPGLARDLAQQGEQRRWFRFAVFGRDGKPCRECGTAIRRGEMAGRRIYWCPRCQV